MRGEVDTHRDRDWLLTYRHFPLEGSTQTPLPAVPPTQGWCPGSSHIESPRFWNLNSSNKSSKGAHSNQSGAGDWPFFAMEEPEMYVDSSLAHSDTGQNLASQPEWRV